MSPSATTPDRLTSPQKRSKTAPSVIEAPTWAAILGALIAIVGFSLMVWYLVGSAKSSTDAEWQRLTFVFTAVQTIVFTAVGWLFGREVSRKQAETAQERADSATEAEKAALTTAADLKARGNAAKAAIAARYDRYDLASQARSRGLADEAGGDDASDSADDASGKADDFGELAKFMNALFPD